jgi:predicted GIY-YIG superfamily endonuclease
MFIYGLYSTENSDKIRYIGKTKCSLSKRLNEHLNGALRFKYFSMFNWNN